MLGVALPCWNTENIKSAIKEWYILRNIEIKKDDIIVRFPWVRGPLDYPSDFPRIPDVREFKDKMYLVIDGHQIGVVSLESFTRHCGICAIHSFYCPLSHEIKSLWLKTIEDYINYMGFSMVVASDGAYNKWASFLKTQEGWVIQELIGNRRMEHTPPSKLMWKCLTNAMPDFNWKKDVFKIT